MTSKINSNELYTVLQESFAVARKEIKLATDQDVRFIIWGGYGNSQSLEIEIRNTEYGDKKVEVKGRALGDLVAEFIRRVHFTNGQRNLLLGKLVIDGEKNG